MTTIMILLLIFVTRRMRMVANMIMVMIKTVATIRIVANGTSNNNTEEQQ